MKTGRVAIALLFAACGGTALADTLDNSKVIALVQAGLDDQVIVAKIRNSGGQYDTSTDTLISLKRAGVSGAVIAAMIEASQGQGVSANAASTAESPDPRVPHPSGIYVLADWRPTPGMMVIDPTTSNQTKSGGFLGYAMTGGLASMSFKAVVPNAHARIKSPNRRPKFYFYFDQAGRSLSGGLTSTIWLSGSVSSPSEFSLVRFDVKSDHREAKVGKFNIAGAKSGVMDKDRISFDYAQISPGVFQVLPNAELQPGEYGFLYSATTGGGGVGIAGMGAMTSRIFDFSIQPSSGASAAKP